MRSLNATQLALLAATDKEISWLFTVLTVGATTYSWSTKAKTFSAVNYTAKVIPDSFAGITLNRAKSEYGIQAPNDLSFQALNTGNSLTDSDFVGATVTVNLVMENATYAATSIMQWKFRVTYCKDIYQILNFNCEDFAQQYLKGYYPLGKKTRALSDSRSITPKDKACVPVIFGTAYIPLRPVYLDADSKFYYVLGVAGPTYTVTAVNTPKEEKTQAEWTSASYTFNQYDKTLKGTSYRVLEPIIAADASGTINACGIWGPSTEKRDMPTEFTSSATSALTSPEEVIEYLLEAFGVPSADIDTGVGSSFATAATTYGSWSLTFNFGLWKKEPKKAILARVLSACHSVLDITDKVCLRVLSKTSKATIDQSYVVRHGDAAEGTFRASPITSSGHDSGYILFQEDGKPQDRFQEVLVSALSAGTTAAISDEQLDVTMIQDTQIAQAIGTLHFQRLLRATGQVSFEAPGKCADLQPDDVITSGHANYGGTYTALIDQLSIDRDGGVRITSLTFSEAFLDFADLAPSAITWVDDGRPFWAEDRPYVTVSPVVGEADFSTIAAALTGLPSWCTRIMLLRGTHVLPSTIALARGIDLIGFSKKESIIVAPDGDLAFTFPSTNVSQNFRFGNFTINELYTSSSALAFFQSSPTIPVTYLNGDIVFEDVILNAQDTSSTIIPIYVVDTHGLLSIHRCKINGGYYGVLSYNTDDVEIVGNVIVGTTSDGVYIYDADRFVIADNRVKDFTGVGIYVSGSSGLLSEMNSIYGNIIKTILTDAYTGQLIGIVIRYTDLSVVANNTIKLTADTDDGVTGIYATQVERCRFAGNMVRIDNPNAGAAANHGLWFLDSTIDCIVSGNHANMVNASAASPNDRGIRFGSGTSGSYGRDNVAVNCGTDAVDGGTNDVYVNETLY